MSLGSNHLLAADGTGPLGPVVGSIAVALIAAGILVYWIRRWRSRR